METSKLLDSEFETLVIRMHIELSDNFNSIKKDMISIKNPTEMKDTLIEIKNNLQGINRRVDKAEYKTIDLEHQEVKNNPSEQQEEKRTKKMRIV